MKSVLMAMVLTVTTVSAFAFDPIIVDNRNMSCSEVQRILRSEGAVKLDGPLWGLDIHYADIPNCEFGWKYEWSYVPAADRKYCAAGYICTPDYGGGGISQDSE